MHVYRHVAARLSSWSLCCARSGRVASFACAVTIHGQRGSVCQRVVGTGANDGANRRARQIQALRDAGQRYAPFAQSERGAIPSFSPLVQRGTPARIRDKWERRLSDEDVDGRECDVPVVRTVSLAQRSLLLKDRPSSDVQDKPVPTECAQRSWTRAYTTRWTASRTSLAFVSPRALDTMRWNASRRIARLPPGDYSHARYFAEFAEQAGVWFDGPGAAGVVRARGVGA